MLQGLSEDWSGTSDHQLWSDDDAGDGGCENDDENGDDCLRDFQTEERLRSRQRLWMRE
jgi:hypothetical protein